MDEKDIRKQHRDEEWREELRKSKTAKERMTTPRVRMPELSPEYRVKCNEEVNQGLSVEMAVEEASRCLDCLDPQCVTGCPVGIEIPAFIKNIERRDFHAAAMTLKATSALPAVCGRVCPQEKQCESKCIYHAKLGKQAVAIGYLERFAQCRVASAVLLVPPVMAELALPVNKCEAFHFPVAGYALGIVFVEVRHVNIHVGSLPVGSDCLPLLILVQSGIVVELPSIAVGMQINLFGMRISRAERRQRQYCRAFYQRGNCFHRYNGVRVFVLGIKPFYWLA